MKDNCSHFILTRFNIVLKNAAGVVPLGSDWLSNRFELFEKFCLPSIKRQTVQEFKWLVFFDKDTPEEFKGRIELYARYQNFVPIFVNDLSNFKKYVADNMRPGTKYLITTRLDNDDSLNMQFVEKLQGLFSNQDLEFVNFTNGYVLNGKRIFIGRQLSNPFISLIEKADDFKTVWVDQHTELSHIGRIREVETEPMWVQVIHGRNLTNCASGKMLPPWEMLVLEKKFNIRNNFIRQAITGMPAYVLQGAIVKSRGYAHFLGLRKSKIAGMLEIMKSVFQKIKRESLIFFKSK